MNKCSLNFQCYQCTMIKECEIYKAMNSNPLINGSNYNLHIPQENIAEENYIHNQSESFNTKQLDENIYSLNAINNEVNFNENSIPQVPELDLNYHFQQDESTNKTNETQQVNYSELNNANNSFIENYSYDNNQLDQSNINTPDINQFEVEMNQVQYDNSPIDYLSNHDGFQNDANLLVKSLHKEYVDRKAKPITRFIAAIIDSIILSIPLNLICGDLINNSIMPVINSFNSYLSLYDAIMPILGKIIALLLLSSLILILYNVVLATLLKGKTLGKKLMKIKIINNEIDNEDVSFGQLFKREIVGKLLCVLTFFIGFIMIFGKNHCGLHDRIAKTKVVLDE